MPTTTERKTYDFFESFQLGTDILRLLESAGEEGLTVVGLATRLGLKTAGQSGNAVPKQIRNKMNAYLKRFLQDKRYQVGAKFGSIMLTPGTRPEQNLTQGREWLWYKKRSLSLSNNETQLIGAITLAHAPFFLAARDRKQLKAALDQQAERSGRAATGLWTQKLEVVPRYPPLFLKDPKPETERAIIDALSEELCFKANYIGDDGYRTYKPLKLVRRERVSYVLCLNELNELREFAMHRFSNLHTVDTPAPMAQAPDADKLQRQSTIDGNWGRLLKPLTFTITGAPAQHLSEMCFDENHPEYTRIISTAPKAPKDNQRLTGVKMEVHNLNYTYEVLCWILGLGHHITVHSPKSVKDDVARNLKALIKSTS